MGALLVALRGVFGYALTKELLELHASMPDALERIRVQAVPFLEAFATAWAFAWWQGLLIIAGCLLAFGMFTRSAAGILLFFFVGVVCIDFAKVQEVMGVWWGVAGIVLCIALFSRWGYVFGGDDLIERIQIKKGKRFHLRA